MNAPLCDTLESQPNAPSATYFTRSDLGKLGAAHILSPRYHLQRIASSCIGFTVLGHRPSWQPSLDGRTLPAAAIGP